MNSCNLSQVVQPARASPEADPALQSRSRNRGCIIALATIVLALAGCFACIVIVLYSSPIEPSDVAEIERRAAPLVMAIDAYTAAQSLPPDNLEQLVPDYLEAIPLPLQGQADPFRYYKRGVAGSAEHSWELMVWGWRGGFYSNEQIEFCSTDRKWRYVPN